MDTLRKEAAKTLVVLGSGGHTAEMVEIVKNLNRIKYNPRYYVLAKSDSISQHKIAEVEVGNDSYQFIEIFRSRNVKQSYLTSVFTTLIAIIGCFPVLWQIKPDLIICNGPGTCVPICLVAWLYKCLRIIPNCKIVFIESICRVKTLSLSGKILLRFADLFVVQWPHLENKKENIKYLGKLI